MLCKYYFVRIVVDLFVGPFNCLNFSLEFVCVCVCVCVCARARARACVCSCARACVSACVFGSFSLSLFFSFLPNIVHFCSVYKLFLLKTI